METSSGGTSRGITITRRDQLPPDLREKYEAIQTRKNAPNPVYELESHRFGKFEATYKIPEFACKGGFSKFFLPRKGELKSTLDTSMVKSKYPTR
jgi:hypothetical protein